MKIIEVSKRCLTKLAETGRFLSAKLKSLIRVWPADYREVNELPVIVLLIIILTVVIMFSPSDIPRIILGLPFVLFLPGYTLLAALYVRRDQMKSMDRLALSFALSMAIVPLIGLVLNYTWGIRLLSFFTAIALFILIMSVIAWIRRGRVAEEERYTLRLRLRHPVLSGGWQIATPAVLGLAALAVFGSLIYVIAVPKSPEYFTEFYLSRPAENLARAAFLPAGIEHTFTVTIVNREGRPFDYRVETRFIGEQVNVTGPLTLENGQKYEAAIDFTPIVVGEGQLVECVLYVEGKAEPYFQLYLRVDVKVLPIWVLWQS